LGGKTNRALVTFEREFDRLVEQQKVAFSLSQILAEAEIG